MKIQEDSQILEKNLEIKKVLVLEFAKLETQLETRNSTNFLINKACTKFILRSLTS